MTEMPPIPEELRRDLVIKLEAIKLSYRQHNAGNIVSFRIHPDENDRSIADIKLGSNVYLAVAEIKDENH